MTGKQVQVIHQDESRGPSPDNRNFLRLLEVESDLIVPCHKSCTDKNIASPAVLDAYLHNQWQARACLCASIGVHVRDHSY